MGCSAAVVLFVSLADGRTGVLKIRPDGTGLEGEAGRLAWLQGRLGSPEPVAWVDDSSGQWLLMTAVPGRMAQEAGDASALARAIGVALRQIHDLPANDCPFADWTPPRILDRVRARTPHAVAPVYLPTGPLRFLHGDACLPNWLIDGEGADLRVTGWVDVGDCGLGDPAWDLHLLRGSFGRNGLRFDREAFIAGYGSWPSDDDRDAWCAWADKGLG